MTDPFDRDPDSKLYGSWVAMGQLSEDWFIACITETAKALMEHMHKSVEPENDITLVFTMEKTEDPDIFSCTGAWKCQGRSKHERKTSAEGSK
jgi:hypothetical protein